MEKDAKVYIAGHGGLLGSALWELFRREGFLNLIGKTRKELDLCDGAAVSEFFRRERPAYVLMAAAKVGGILANRDYPADFLYENLAIELNLIRNAYEHGVKKLIFFGSSCMYPKNALQPMKEEYIGTGEVESTSRAYATAKLAGMEMCCSYNRQYGTQFITAIPNTLYGPNDDFNPASSHVLPGLIRKFHDAKINKRREVVLWGTGLPRREFLYVDDVARASLSLLALDVFPGNILNIGSGVDYSIADVADMVRRVVGFSGEIIWDTSKPDGTPRKLLDASRIRSLGWEPEISLEMGIRNTYEWFRASHK